MQRVVPHPTIKDRLSALVVGLSQDWETPETPIEELFAKNLPEAKSYPLVAFLTVDGKWIEGYSGWLEEPEFLKMLARVEASPLLQAEPAVQKQLAKHSAAANAAVAKGDWKVVLGAAREAAKTTGRCAERTAIRTAEQQARTWANEQLEACVKGASSGADLAPFRKQLGAVKTHFAGEPEGVDAETGLKALQRLTMVREVEANPNPARDLRERSAAPFQGTRWVAIFAKPAQPGGK
ncbi:MAG TPA: hypothetical protein VFZ65_10320 [Planctomycetota bacterium]|nr:hypothetical protein [Planctomycetota bacterium]